MKRIRFPIATWIAMLIIGVCLLGLQVQPVQAAVIDEDGNVGAKEVIQDDLIIGGQNVIIDGTVNGAVLAAGERIVVNGTINGDLFAWGQSVLLAENGKVSGNVFIGAQSSEVRGKVGGSVFTGATSMLLGSQARIDRNLYFGGYSLETLSGSVIKIDALVGAYQIIHAGEIQQNLKGGVAGADLKGKVGKDVSLDVAAPGEMDSSFWMFGFQPGMPRAIEPGLRVAPEAIIGGNLTYTSPAEQASAIQARPKGQVIYQTPTPEESMRSKSPLQRWEEHPLLKTLLHLVRNLIVLLILGGLALWLIPGLFQKTVEAANAKPLPAAGVGILTLLGGYAGAILVGLLILAVGVILSLVTLGGLSNAIFGIGFSALALAVAIFTLLVGYGSKLVVSFWVGKLLLEKTAPQTRNMSTWALVLGVALYAIVRAIPFLGWLAGLIATLIGLGAMWFTYQNRKTPAAEPVPAPLPEQG
ncbi:MAG: polymer-forming cytoskeletal protein [Anaerolinea sp.]